MFIDLFLCLIVVVVSLFVGCTFLRVYLRIVSSLIISIISIPFSLVCKCWQWSLKGKSMSDREKMSTNANFESTQRCLEVMTSVKVRQKLNLSVPRWVFVVISIFLLIIIISSIYYLNNFQVRRIFRDRMPRGYFEKQLRRNSLQLQSFDSFCCLTWLQW